MASKIADYGLVEIEYQFIPHNVTDRFGAGHSN
jgi:hypothetical protein